MFSSLTRAFAAQWALTTGVAHLLAPLRAGFHSVCPSEAVERLAMDGATLQKAVCGEPMVDLMGAVRAAARYAAGASAAWQPAVWLWEILGEQTAEIQHAFWVFCSGPDGLPADGAAAAPMLIQRVARVVAPGSQRPNLLMAHTCYICCELPEYISKEETKVALMATLAHGLDCAFVLAARHFSFTHTDAERSSSVGQLA